MSYRGRRAASVQRAEDREVWLKWMSRVFDVGDTIRRSTCFFCPAFVQAKQAGERRPKRRARAKLQKLPYGIVLGLRRL